MTLNLFYKLCCFVEPSNTLITDFVVINHTGNQTKKKQKNIQVSNILTTLEESEPCVLAPGGNKKNTHQKKHLRNRMTELTQMDI